jgi:putative hemolysin
MLYFEIGIVAALICVNGLLAMSELAVVSSRPARLRMMVEQGVSGSRRALALAADPGRFLSTVQIGITLVGVLSGAFSGATLGQRLSEWFGEKGMPDAFADAAGVGLVVALITYASLIVGELVPKQIALRNPEGVAVRVAPAMTLLSKFSYPLVWLLSASGQGVLKLLGQGSAPEDRVTEEELKTIVAEAETAGVLETEERQMIAGVLRLGDRAVRAVMTPRTEVDWIALDASEEEVRKILIETKHSRLPAADGSPDDMTGVVHAREVLAALLAGKPFDIRSYVRKAPVIHDNADALDVLATLKAAQVPMALVHDEYGHFEGVVTPADLLEAITGVFNADSEGSDPVAVQRDDGSWLLAGYMPADEMAEQIGIRLPENRDYETVAGFVLSHLHHLPATGEWVNAHGWRFEVVDLDGRRIDKVLATKQPALRRERVG